MFGVFRRHSAFRQAVEKAGIERCSISGQDLWIGLPPSPGHRRVPLLVLPESPKSLLFVEGPEQVDIIAALAASPEAMTVENLMIGTSHDFIPTHRAPYDFSEAIAALQKARMPALKRLALGEMELLFNGHAYYGHLGDLTGMFGIAPNLIELHIRGRATLARPVHHHSLQVLSIIADDIAGHSGATSSETVTNILSSQLPNLTQLHLSLEADDGPSYVIPETFYAGNNMPALSQIEMDCLVPVH